MNKKHRNKKPQGDRDVENISGGKTNNNTKESTNSPMASLSKPQSYLHQSRKYELKICDLNEEIRLFNKQD